MIQFDPRSFRYRNVRTGKFASRVDLLRLLDSEVNRLEVRLKGHARLLTSNRIDLPEFQRRMAHDLKLSSLRTSALGAGGVKQLDAAHFGREYVPVSFPRQHRLAVGQQLRVQYKYLGGFGDAIASGKLTEKQIIARAASYASSVRIGFYRSELIGRGRQGFECKRLLDAGARHCSSCIAHQRHAWTPVEEVTPPTVNCTCSQRCKCRLIFRRRPDAKILNRGI